MDSIFVCFFVMVRREVYIGMGSLVAVGVVGDAIRAGADIIAKGIDHGFAVVWSGVVEVAREESDSRGEI